MSASTLVCKNELRRNQVRHKKGLNGLDYVEVSDDQLCLTVYFLGKAPLQLEKENIRIQGGRRIVNIQVTGLEIHSDIDCPDVDDCAHITVDKSGDFSTYRLCLIEIDSHTKKPVVDIGPQAGQQFRPMSGIDPRYACLDFSFKASCPSDLDCKSPPPCPPEQRTEPPINYLAKDYASFRQLILDRMALTMPDWKERHVPDLGITLVELLAYAGDQLSYYQDAVATEAYLDTARRRISVRRHVRLVDYHLHEGCNSRAWVAVEISVDKLELKPMDFYLITDPGLPTLGNILNSTELPNKQPRPYLIFEPLVEDSEQTITFYAEHNEITIYTWGDTECCLPRGATSATLIDPGQAAAQTEHADHNSEHDECCCHEKDSVPGSVDSGYKLQFKPCDILIFEEIKGPKTGNKADADPSHRHAVRLTKAQKSQDPLTGRLIWEIEWSPEDALPFALCLSSIKKDDCSPISGVSIVRGNVLLVDHGERVKDDLPEVPLETLQAECGCGCTPREATKVAGRFEPTLPRTGLTFSQPLLACNLKALPCMSAPKFTPASAMLKQEVRLATPELRLNEIPPPSKEPAHQTLAEHKQHNLESAQDIIDIAKAPIWEPRLELLGSGPFDPHFVVEMEDDRQAKLRFGNGESGRIPNAQTCFQADYRIGNGAVGNVGAESINHLVLRNQTLNGVTITLRNPLPAIGGTNPEPIAEAKLFAPQAFRKDLQRAITADDYAQIVMRDFPHQVQRAKAKLRWTGNWFEVLVAIDPLGTEEADEPLLCAIKQHLCRYRRIGHDIVVVQAAYVALDIAMTVCVLPHYLRGHVKAALLDVFSARTMPNGDKGFFHPDNLSFGEGIYLSRLVAAAQAVAGIENVVVTKLERFSLGSNQEIDNGLLALGDFEVARLDSDPSFPENGKFTLDMRGGR